MARSSIARHIAPTSAAAPVNAIDQVCWNVKYYFHSNPNKRKDARQSLVAATFAGERPDESPWQYQADFIRVRAASHLRRITRHTPEDSLWWCRPLAMAPWMQKELLELPAYEYIGKHGMYECCWMEKHDLKEGRADDERMVMPMRPIHHGTVAAPQRPAQYPLPARPANSMSLRADGPGTLYPNGIPTPHFAMSTSRQPNHMGSRPDRRSPPAIRTALTCSATPRLTTADMYALFDLPMSPVPRPAGIRLET